jgi:hypothetical protein
MDPDQYAVVVLAAPPALTAAQVQQMMDDFADRQRELQNMQAHRVTSEAGLVQ